MTKTSRLAKIRAGAAAVLMSRWYLVIMLAVVAGEARYLPRALANAVAFGALSVAVVQARRNGWQEPELGGVRRVSEQIGWRIGHAIGRQRAPRTSGELIAHVSDKGAVALHLEALNSTLVAVSRTGDDVAFSILTGPNRMRWVDADGDVVADSGETSPAALALRANAEQLALTADATMLFERWCDEAPALTLVRTSPITDGEVNGYARFSLSDGTSTLIVDHVGGLS